MASRDDGVEEAARVVLASIDGTALALQTDVAPVVPAWKDVVVASSSVDAFPT